MAGDIGQTAAQVFYEVLREKRSELRAAQAELVSLTGKALLPVPESMGGPALPFRTAVDDYARTHNVSRAETFRRVAEVTGNSLNGLSLRYCQRGEHVWRFPG